MPDCMLRLIAKSSAGVLIACLVMGVASFWRRQGSVEWAPVVLVSIVAATLFAIRFYFLLRNARPVILQRRALYLEASQELIDDMARLSLADLSMFIIPGRDPCDHTSFSTAQGSPNHHVLVQMSDLGLAAPERMDSLSSEGRAYTVARYRLTAEGQASLPTLLPWVAKRRSWFAAKA